MQSKYTRGIDVYNNYVTYCLNFERTIRIVPLAGRRTGGAGSPASIACGATSHITVSK